jgi:hypothetical protein
MKHTGSIRHIPKQISVCAVFFAVVLTVTSCAGSGVPAFSAEGTIVFVDGEVLIDGEAAGTGAAVSPSSLISTGDTSSVEITFGSANIVRIGANASVRLDLKADATGEITVNRGWLSAVFEGLQDFGNRDAIRFRTSLMQAGVRGTSFCTWVDPDTETYFCVCNGEIGFDAHDHDPFSIEASHHRAVRFTADGDDILITDAPMWEHTDTDLERLAAKIGETIDWTSAK